MRVLGLFVGVDDQEDETVRVLPFAGHDAEALWAAFADVNAVDPEACPEDTVLLLGRNATRAAVAHALEEMVARSHEGEYGLAVIHFSCHGTPDGHLLFYDSRRDTPKETRITFGEVANCIRFIRADHVVAAFDTCFSGLALGMLSEDRSETLQDRMRALGTGNRAVVMAALATERAWESAHLEHGLLSYGLIRGLDGTTLPDARGQISITRWIEHAVQTVVDQAALEGRMQTPRRFFDWAGTPTMPAVPPGPHRAALAARRALRPVTPEIESLAVYAFSGPMIDAIRRRIRDSPLNDMQVRAINEAGVLAARNVIVAAPTLSGKTLIGELAVLAAHNRRRKSVVLLPTRALSNEKWSEFRDTFSSLGVRSVRSYGGVEDDDAALATLHFDVAFLTYEKFLLLALTRPGLMDALGVIVLDEVQLLGDQERGRTVETLLTLCRWRQRQGKQFQLIALSAALGGTNGFDQWLDARVVSENSRPIPLREGVISPSGRYRFRDSDSGEIGAAQIFAPISARGPFERAADVSARVAVALAQTLVTSSDAERLLAFRAHKPDTRRLSARLCDGLGLGRCIGALERALSGADGRDDSRATLELFRHLEGGVGFHISDLEQREREAIEAAFRAGELRCLVATLGLAMGINTPATSVIVVDHKRYSGQWEDYKVGEYKNMAGRAGRWIAGVERGSSYLIAVDEAEADELFERYVLRSPEPLVSRLAEADRRDLVLALLTILGQGSEADLLDLARLTFDGFLHGGDAAWRAALRDDLRSALELLERGGFVVRGTDGIIEPTPAGLICGREGLRVESAVRVHAAADAAFASGEPLDEKALVVLAQITAELDGLYMPTGGKDAEMWPRIVDSKLLNDRRALRDALSGAPEEVVLPRLKRAYAVSRWVQGEAIERIERELSAFLEPEKRDEPVAGTIRQTATRTGDVLRGVAKLVALRRPEHAETLKQLALGLRPRLEYGLSGAASELARHRLGLTRGEVRRLFELGIVDLDGLRDGLEREVPEVMAIFGSVDAHRLRGKIRRLSERAAAVRRADDEAQLALFEAIGEIDLSS